VAADLGKFVAAELFETVKTDSAIIATCYFVAW